MSQQQIGYEAQHCSRTPQQDALPNAQTTGTKSGTKQGSNLLGANASIAVPRRNNSNKIVQQQQQQLSMMWKTQGSFAPNPAMAPTAPVSASTINLVKKTEPASKSTKGKASKTSTNESSDGIDNDKTEKNRERNREHARCTRLRKKAYIQKLKDTANGLRAVQTKEIRERRVSMQYLLNIQKVRRSVVQTVLNYHASYEKDTMKWKMLLEDSFWMKEPVTPFRSFRRSEVDRDCRIVRGIDAVICDAASIAAMIERIGCYNARWRRIKRSDFLGSFDNRDMVNQEIDDVDQQPESSLSGESSSDSSRCSETIIVSKRNRAMMTDLEGTSNAASTAAKISSSSESDKNNQNYSESTIDRDSKVIASSSDESNKEPPSKRVKTDALNFGSFRQKANRSTGTHPVLSPAYLSMVNVERISAYYALNEDDMSILDDVLMCPFVFRTRNAVLCGALADCVVPGMLRAKFSKNNKLLNMELVFDAMGFMQQLDGANGGDANAQVIPGSLEMALVPCPNEARVITEARSPYRVIFVNETWTRLTNYSQTEAEGKPLLSLLQSDSFDSSAHRNGRSHVALDDVISGRPACSTSIHNRRIGKSFVDFMCSYPLTNATDEITHILHVSTELPQIMALIS